MGSITPFATPSRGHVRLEIDWTSQAQSTMAFVYRVVNGALTPLRDANPVLLSHGKAVVYDTEAPLDTPLHYRTVCPLDANGTFEFNVEQWINSVTTGTASQSLDYYAPGTSSNASLKLLPNQVASSSYAASESIPATVGTSYTLTADMMVGAPWSGGIGLLLFWYTSLDVFISSSGSLDDQWPVPGQWSSYSVTATAPATTAKVRALVAGIFGNASPSVPVYVDNAYLTTATSTVDSVDLVLNSEGMGWWKDPLHPAANVRLAVDLTNPCQPAPGGVAYLGTGDRNRTADAAVLPVPDTAKGIGIWAKRKSWSSSMRVATRSYADADRVDALHDSGAPLMLQLPAQYGEPDQYQQHGDVASGRLAADQRKQWKVTASNYNVVSTPVGPAEGVLGTRYVDLTKYSTYAAANAAGVTWFDALQGELAP